jgi:hypothetical protein
MAYHPLINNVLPYGLATFNRNGFYSNLNWKNVAKSLNINWAHYMLSEIRGQGTKALKKYTMSQVQLGVDVNKFIKLERKLKISTSLVYQQTDRTSDIDFEKVNLNSIQLATGLEWEVATNFDFMLGYTMLKGDGNDQISLRNNYSQVTDFQNYLGLLYQQFEYVNDNFTYDNYKMNQISIIYNLLF